MLTGNPLLDIALVIGAFFAAKLVVGKGVSIGQKVDDKQEVLQGIVAHLNKLDMGEHLAPLTNLLNALIRGDLTATWNYTKALREHLGDEGNRETLKDAVFAKMLKKKMETGEGRVAVQAEVARLSTQELNIPKAA